MSATGNEQKHCDKLVLTKRARFMIENMVLLQHVPSILIVTKYEKEKKKGIILRLRVVIHPSMQCCTERFLIMEIE